MMHVNMMLKVFFLPLIIVLLSACGGDSKGDGNASPVVNVTIDTDATVGVEVRLSATATDPDRDMLQYAWSITSAPVGSTVLLANADQSVSTFIPDLEGHYTVQIVVSDGTHEVTRSATIQATQAATVGATVVGVTIESTSGVEQNTVPITFGQVFKPGEIPGETLLGVRLADGAQELIPSQINKKATHADGSLRHAVVTVRVPTLMPNNPQEIEIVVVDSVPTAQPVPLADLLTTNFNGKVSLTVEGTVYTVSITDLLDNTPEKIWLSGSEVTEWIVSAPLKTAEGTEHPHLTARFNVRAYANFDSVRVDVIIENNWAYVPNPQNFVYDATVTLCGNDVYSKAELTHYHHARWRKTFWCGSQPQVHISHDIDYLISSGAVPNYDQTLVVPELDLAKMDSDWITDISQPMNIGFAQAYMPGTGARPDIGPLPRWVARYLLSQDVRSKTAMLGTADLAGSWSIHYRDQATSQPISIVDFPYVSLLGRFNSTLNPSTGIYEALPNCGGDCVSPYTPDSAHQPSFSYVPYLVTGDYYHLEELLFWANYNVMRAHPTSRKQQQGLVKWEQARGQAWSLRTLGQAAYISPNNHPLKQYFIDKIDNNIAYYDAQYTNNSSAPALGFITNGFAIKKESGRGSLSPWNDDALTTVVQRLTEMGFSNAIPFRDWKVKFVYGRFSNTPIFCQTNAAAYRYVVQDTYQGEGFPVANTWSELHNLSFPSDTDNCPTGYDKGLPRNPESYLAITRGALAAAVAGYSDANSYINTVITILDNSNANFNSTPQWAIVPRN